MQNEKNSMRKDLIGATIKEIKNERHAAVSVLLEIGQQGAYNNIALRRVLDAQTQWQPYQKAFVTELVNGTLRNRILIDHIIDSYSRKPSSKMKPFIRELLRTGVYQILRMDKVPPSAAVNEAVKLARANGFSALSGFVNGILRNIVRGHEDGTLLMPQDLGLKYSYPNWLVKALTKWLGAEGAKEFCAASHVPPPVTICTNLLKTSRDALMLELETSGIKCTKSDLAGPCLHLERTSDITASKSYRQGHFFVMDENAYIAAAATLAGPGRKMIDLCAAPGGKSFACAGLMENCGQIIASDIHPHKVSLIKNTAGRLGISCITAEERDAATVNPAWENWADIVLLDAPCSGLGVIRKKPDIKYTKTFEDIKSMAAYQRTLLSAAAGYVRPGGVLVYSTCTVSKEENEDNVRWFLDNFPYDPDGPALKMNGFFTARLIRKKTLHIHN